MLFFFIMKSFFICILSSSVMYLQSFIQFVVLGNSWVYPG